MSERELQEAIQGCIKGQRKEQQILYQFLAPQLMKVCMRYSDSKDVAKDYLQDGLIKIFHNIGHYRSEGPFPAWARRILVHTIIDSIRKQGTIVKTISLEDLREGERNKMHSNASDELDYSDIVYFINKLPEAKKIIFNLYAIEGYTHKEIAQELDITEGTSKSQLHKARELLVKMHQLNNHGIRTNEDLARTY